MSRYTPQTKIELGPAIALLITITITRTIPRTRRCNRRAHTLSPFFHIHRVRYLICSNNNSSTSIAQSQSSPTRLSNPAYNSSTILLIPSNMTETATPLSKVDSLNGGADAKAKGHRRASSSAADVYSMADLGEFNLMRWTHRRRPQ